MKQVCLFPYSVGERQTVQLGENFSRQVLLSAIMPTSGQSCQFLFKPVSRESFGGKILFGKIIIRELIHLQGREGGKVQIKIIPGQQLQGQTADNPVYAGPGCFKKLGQTNYSYIGDYFHATAYCRWGRFIIVVNG